MNYLGRYKRRDLLNDFFDSNSTNSGLYTVVGKLYDIDDTSDLNKFFAGRTTKDISKLVIDKLEKNAKEKDDD